MEWLQRILNHLKEPSAQTHEQLSAGAIKLFTESVKQKNVFGSEKLWLGEFVGSIRAIEERGATHLWLDTVESTLFLLDDTDKIIQSLRTALFVETGPKICNVRKMWESFVHNAIVRNNWDISHWPQRNRWFKLVLSQSWSSKDVGIQNTLNYAKEIANNNVWARDALLEYRVLNLTMTATVDTMFKGVYSTSLPFIIATSGIVLRMYLKTPTPAAILLYQQACAAWPVEIAQLEATMQIVALIDNTPLEVSASIAAHLELGTGYSACLPFYGERIHALINDRILEHVALPELD